MAVIVAAPVRDRIALPEVWLDPLGRVVLPSAAVSRRLAHRLRRDAGSRGRDPVPFTAGRLQALHLLGELVDRMLAYWVDRREPELLTAVSRELEEELGEEGVRAVLRSWSSEYLDPRRGAPEDRQDEVYLERQLLLFALGRRNRAAADLNEFLQESELWRGEELPRAVGRLVSFLQGTPGGARGGRSLLQLLTEPFEACPDSLTAQLKWALAHWRFLLGDDLAPVLAGLDLLAEEEAPRTGPGDSLDVAAPRLDLAGSEPRYSPDRGWMSGLVLLAKNALVWLDQLSREYQRPIRRLDQVPDEELDRIAARGFTGLWLIGLWERSPASRRIKQLCGNPEAVGSAYSIKSYTVAAELGGEAALSNLQERAWGRGIRLGADMVPNHMGLDSEWVLGHPERFLGRAESPYPAYTFAGPDLSPDPDIGIYLEDHYYDRTDAAVVFKRIDRRTGESRYLYHGNDGTSMPWNDTAQLDYLNPSVREAMIEQILAVARRFPIIRFDAAMTLARRHFRRLWFPEPGDGGAVPSRSDFAMAARDFDRLMPHEFWRQVVDRVTAEAPETLLLAEAFWLMEGYFVRSLGMHRVYNSAFMHMLRDRENRRYREMLKETLAFDPGILQRYVNFMSNPDERTAVDQFGSDDRYFGVCVVMATLPGLPMFGHGQVEGYAEKYGMEYARAYWNERPDPYLIARHEEQISPLLRSRKLFAGVSEFCLYDLRLADGSTHEDVLAFSNGVGRDRRLTLFNNGDSPVHGWLQPAELERADGGTSSGRALWESLELGSDPRFLCRFRDSIHEREFLLRSGSIVSRGLEVRLAPFESRVLEGFREVVDDSSGAWSELERRLGGSGIEDLHGAIGNLLREGLKRQVGAVVAAALAPEGSPDELLRELDSALDRLQVPSEDRRRRLASARRRLRLIAQPDLLLLAVPPEDKTVASGAGVAPEDRGALRAAVVIAALAAERALAIGQPEAEEVLGWGRERLVAHLAGPSRRRALMEKLVTEGWVDRHLERPEGYLRAWLGSWLEDRDLERLLEVEGEDENRQLSREALAELLRWRGLAAALAEVGRERATVGGWASAVQLCRRDLQRLERAAAECDYRLEALAELSVDRRTAEE